MLSNVWGEEAWTGSQIYLIIAVRRMYLSQLAKTPVDQNKQVEANMHNAMKHIYLQISNVTLELIHSQPSSITQNTSRSANYLTNVNKVINLSATFLNQFKDHPQAVDPSLHLLHQLYQRADSLPFGPMRRDGCQCIHVYDPVVN